MDRDKETAIESAKIRIENVKNEKKMGETENLIGGEMTTGFLHRHPEAEKLLVQICGEDFANDHVIVDKREWEAVLVAYKEKVLELGKDRGVKNG